VKDAEYASLDSEQMGDERLHEADIATTEAKELLDAAAETETT